MQSYSVDPSKYHRLAEFCRQAGIEPVRDRVTLVSASVARLGPVGTMRSGTFIRSRLLMLFDGSEIPTMPRERVSLGMSSGLVVVHEGADMGERSTPTIVVNEADANELLGR